MGRSDRMNFNAMYNSGMIPNVETGNQHNCSFRFRYKTKKLILCNLKCRMCGPSSSQFEKELLENTEILRPFLGKQ